MNVFKFAGANGRYLIAVPYRDKHRDGWLVLEESHEDIVIQYQYVPNFEAKVQCYNHGKRRLYLYGSKSLYLRHCYIKHPPAWAVMGKTLI